MTVGIREERALLEEFERGTLAGLSHENHIKLVWLYLKRLAVPETMIKMRDGLKRFATKKGVPEKYNETVTCAYVGLIARRAREGAANWEAFAEDNPDLFEPWPKVLGAYYRQDTLTSERAKTDFVFPDVARPALTACRSRAEPFGRVEP